MEQIKFGYDRAYFGAANGYSGFRSQFGEIFNSHNMEKLYILKGGPGTGKSTILKRILADKRYEGCYKEAVFCSSDPASLDGVILSREGRKIAVLDGTAPHERDAVIPGAVDELINLGDGFDIGLLTSRRDKIKELIAKKKSAYKRAYLHLSVAGSMSQAINAICLENGYYSEAEMDVLERHKSNRHEELGATTLLYTSAFCSRGYHKIEYLPPAGCKRIGVGGDGIREYIMMQKIIESLPKSVIREIHASPLSDKKIERIITDDACYEVSDSAHDIYFSCCDRSDKALKQMLDMHNGALDMAKAEFEHASGHHFALEEIYSKAMQFTVCDAALEKITAGIDKALRI